jgi:hypothetical protein
MIYNLGPRWHHDTISSRKPLVMIRSVVDMGRQRDLVLAAYPANVGISSFFARFIQIAKKEAGHELCWWETGRVCERRYRVGEQ